MSIATFPISLISTLTGGPEFSTDVIVGGNGQEVRNANWQDGLWRWNASSSVRTRADVFTLYSFFLACRGRETAFLVQDAFDYKVPQTGTTFQTFGTGDGSTTTFQLYKRYTDGYSNNYDRDIKRPSSTGSDLVVKNNLVTVVQGAGAGKYQYSSTTGIVTFGTAPSNGNDLTFTLAKFYVLARFDIDKFPAEMLMWDGADYSLHQFPELPIVEVRE